jgi:hypothetical protein
VALVVVVAWVWAVALLYTVLASHLNARPYSLACASCITYCMVNEYQ